MNNPLFPSPTEAINACNANCDKEWEHFAKMLKLDHKTDPKTYAASKDLFRAGYMAGAKWVTGAIVQKMMAQSIAPLQKT